MAIRGAIFDMDGTLTESICGSRSAGVTSRASATP